MKNRESYLKKLKKTFSELGFYRSWDYWVREKYPNHKIIVRKPKKGIILSITKDNLLFDTRNELVIDENKKIEDVKNELIIFFGFDNKNLKKRVAKIDMEIIELRNVLSKKEKEIYFIQGMSISDYEMRKQFLSTYTDQINAKERERRMIMPYELFEIGKKEKIISVDRFIQMVDSDIYNDENTYGYYVKDNMKTNVPIYPSDVRFNTIRDDFDTIITINK